MRGHADFRQAHIRSAEKYFLQNLSQLFPLLRQHLFQIPLLPQDCWQVPCFRYAEKFPVRSTALEADQELAVRVWHLANHCGDECLAGSL